MRRIIMLLGVVALLCGCGRLKGPNADIISDPQRAFCRTAIMSFLEAHALMSDESGRIVQLNDAQTETMKNLIRTGMTAASGVSDTFLTKVDPELPSQFRSNLVKGWELYLNGLEQSKPRLQVQGIQLVQQWEAFKAKKIDYIYRTLIE